MLEEQEQGTQLFTYYNNCRYSLTIFNLGVQVALARAILLVKCNQMQQVVMIALLGAQQWFSGCLPHKNHECFSGQLVELHNYPISITF